LYNTKKLDGSNIDKEERSSRVPRLSYTPVTQLKGQKGNGDMQATKRD